MCLRVLSRRAPPRRAARAFSRSALRSARVTLGSDIGLIFVSVRVLFCSTHPLNVAFISFFCVQHLRAAHVALQKSWLCQESQAHIGLVHFV